MWRGRHLRGRRGGRFRPALALLSGEDDLRGSGMQWIEVLLPIVAGALVAGISAALKMAIERWDARKQAQARLSLATARTEFVSAWYDVSIRVGGDEEYVAAVAQQARAELNDAYMDAQAAMESGRAAIEDSQNRTWIWTLRRMLALGPYERRWTFVVPVVLYSVLGWLALGATVAITDPTIADGDLTPTSAVITLIGLYLILRLVAQLPIALLERDRPGSGDEA